MSGFNMQEWLDEIGCGPDVPVLLRLTLMRTALLCAKVTGNEEVEKACVVALASEEAPFVLPHAFDAELRGRIAANYLLALKMGMPPRARRVIERETAKFPRLLARERFADAALEFATNTIVPRIVQVTLMECRKMPEVMDDLNPSTIEELDAIRGLDPKTAAEMIFYWLETRTHADPVDAVAWWLYSAMGLVVQSMTTLVKHSTWKYDAWDVAGNQNVVRREMDMACAVVDLISVLTALLRYQRRCEIEARSRWGRLLACWSNEEAEGPWRDELSRRVLEGITATLTPY